MLLLGLFFFFFFFSHHGNYSLFTYLVACLLAGWLSLLLTMTRCWPLSLFDWLSRDRTWEYFVRSSKEMLRKTENSKIDSSSKKNSSRVKLIKNIMEYLERYFFSSAYMWLIFIKVILYVKWSIFLNKQFGHISS